ncbi:hypothetical protein ACTQ33_15550 [Candidatus Avoscillospira sp. LCP25S3_F1]|uniref:hypothetical protein n=1 Tax=Candidatus Avoscillospira sp. LCP25S3_F1 TaxID=3438825 RepID=UPI003F9266B8
MKRFQRVLALLMTLSMVLSLAACSGEGTASEITGVTDQSVAVGTEFDAMAGVSAVDVNGKDITSKIVVTSLPELQFSNGKATPDSPGTYELTYAVTSGGTEVKAYATLTVTRQTGDATVLQEMDFSTPDSPDDHGWTAKIGQNADATGEQKEGAYVFQINSPGKSDQDIQLVKSGVALKAAEYRVKVWAKATAETYAHILAMDEKNAGNTLGGAYNLVIGEDIAPLELTFTSTGESSAELLVNLGKITPNPDNPGDTTPDNVTVTIDKIEIYELSGAQTKTPVYANTFSEADQSAITLTAGDGASGSTKTGGGAAEITIDAYPSDGGVWSIKADLALPGVAIQEGEKYYYSFTVQADSDQIGECLVESAAQADGARANFNSLSLTGGEETAVTNIFTAESTVDDPVIRLQLGEPSNGTISNTLRITNLEFGTVDGDLTTNKTIDSFSVSIAANPNPNYFWTTYNGTDEDNELGVGTIWTEDGSLFYRIDQAGTVDWHNKLILGHGEKPITLPADSYFTVEITAKASQPISCGFYLNPMGGWDPRVSENIDFTTEEQTFTFRTTDTLIMDMDFEMLFQFGSADAAALGSTTIEISNITIYQESLV